MRFSQILRLPGFVLTGIWQAGETAVPREGKNVVFVLTGDPLRGGETLRAFQNVRFRARKIAISHAIFESAVGDRESARTQKCRKKREKPEVGGLRFRVFTGRLSLVRKMSELPR